jgi:hypothetical protein
LEYPSFISAKICQVIPKQEELHNKIFGNNDQRAKNGYSSKPY